MHRGVWPLCVNKGVWPRCLSKGARPLWSVASAAERLRRVCGLLTQAGAGGVGRRIRSRHALDDQVRLDGHCDRGDGLDRLGAEIADLRAQLFAQRRVGLLIDGRFGVAKAVGRGAGVVALERVGKDLLVGGATPQAPLDAWCGGRAGGHKEGRAGGGTGDQFGVSHGAQRSATADVRRPASEPLLSSPARLSAVRRRGDA